jgi:hypothetical protein
MPHSLQLLNDGLHAAGSDEQSAVRQSARNIVRELFASQQLRGQDWIFRLHKTHASMELYGNSR